MMQPDLIERLHATPEHGVLAITGGGSGAIERLLTTPGASATVLEAIVPYSHASLSQWLGGRPDGACTSRTARAMAMRAFGRARELDPAGDPLRLFGVGCTAGLASNRPKRGDHRAHVAVQTATSTRVVSLGFEKGRRTRAEEELATAHAVVATLAQTLGVHDIDLSRTPPGIEAATDSIDAPPEWTALLSGESTVAPVDAPSPGEEPLCLFPGSFNPPHEGHAQIARLAAERTGRPVIHELSITNVEKPPLDFLEVRDRLAGLEGRPAWLTAAPTFAEKAELAPGAVFAVGADTIERIGRPAYYADQPAREAAFARLDELGCRFLVFGRLVDGRFHGLEEIKLPSHLRALCDGVPESAFRFDISSTEVREASSE